MWTCECAKSLSKQNACFIFLFSKSTGGLQHARVAEGVVFCDALARDQLSDDTDPRVSSCDITSDKLKNTSWRGCVTDFPHPPHMRLGARGGFMAWKHRSVSCVTGLCLRRFIALKLFYGTPLQASSLMDVVARASRMIMWQEIGQERVLTRTTFQGLWCAS